MALFRIFRGHTDFDMMHLEVMRETIKRSRELLANTPIPDTFAGRKTQEPFPQENPGELHGEYIDLENRVRDYPG